MLGKLQLCLGHNKMKTTFEVFYFYPLPKQCVSGSSMRINTLKNWGNAAYQPSLLDPVEAGALCIGLKKKKKKHLTKVEGFQSMFSLRV